MVDGRQPANSFRDTLYYGERRADGPARWRTNESKKEFLSSIVRPLSFLFGGSSEIFWKLLSLSSTYFYFAVIRWNFDSNDLL